MCKSCYNGPATHKQLTIMVLLGMPVRVVAAVVASVFLGAVALVMGVIYPNDSMIRTDLSDQIKSAWSWAVWGGGIYEAKKQ